MVKIAAKQSCDPEIVTVTPEMAAKLLELNHLNRALSDGHVKRIADQIKEGKWKFNGDTIKIAIDNGVLDGQHRLWAIVESQIAVKTIIVHGIERDAFATIDTLRKPRSVGDTMSINGLTRYRNVAGTALQWLIRYQRGILTEYKRPEHRIENADVEEAYKNHPQIGVAVERSSSLRGLANPSVMGFFYYVLSNQNAELAELMMNVLTDPTGTSVNDPFYRLRAYFVSDHHKRKDPVVTIALAIKASNASYRNEEMQRLLWKSIGPKAEEFPKLSVSTDIRQTAKQRRAK
jgi:hypothetical protein